MTVAMLVELVAGLCWGWAEAQYGGPDAPFAGAGRSVSAGSFAGQGAYGSGGGRAASSGRALGGYGSGGSAPVSSGRSPISIRPFEDASLGNCFVRRANCVLVHASPFERRVVEGAEECAALCRGLAGGRLAAPDGLSPLRFHCRSLVYDHQGGLCDLYAVTVRRSPATALPLRGYQYMELLAECREEGGAGAYGAAPAVAPPAAPGPEAWLKLSTVAVTGPPVPTDAGPREGGRFCARGSRAVFQRMEGWAVAGADDAVLPAVSERECLSLCERDDRGDGQELLCWSAEFNTFEGSCTLSTTAPAPTALGVLLENPDKILYQKMCVLESEAERSCPNGLVVRQPNTALEGFAVEAASLEVGSLEECVELCIRIGPELCVSANYFEERVGRANCAVSSESVESQPGALVGVEGELAEYVDLSLCRGDLPPGLAAPGPRSKHRAFTRLRNIKLKQLAAVPKRTVSLKQRSRQQARPQRRREAGRRLRSGADPRTPYFRPVPSFPGVFGVPSFTRIPQSLSEPLPSDAPARLPVLARPRALTSSGQASRPDPKGSRPRPRPANKSYKHFRPIKSYLSGKQSERFQIQATRHAMLSLGSPRRSEERRLVPRSSTRLRRGKPGPPRTLARRDVPIRRRRRPRPSRSRPRPSSPTRTSRRPPQPFPSTARTESLGARPQRINYRQLLLSKFGISA